MFRYVQGSKPDLDGHRYMFILLEQVSITPMFQWCVEQFGLEPDEATGSRWYCIGGRIFFRDEIDAFQFRMRWC